MGYTYVRETQASLSLVQQTAFDPYSGLSYTEFREQYFASEKTDLHFSSSVPDQPRTVGPRYKPALSAE
jgi:hypothetical protein